jgi:DNA-binding transcriptional MerR regulator
MKQAPEAAVAAPAANEDGAASSPTTPIPDKTYFRIGEVARILGVKPYVLRYWESEFRAIRPQKSRSQQRLYRRRDVELLLRIKKLLYEQRFTIEGARRKLRGEADTEREAGETKPETSARPAAPAKPSKEFFDRLRTDLEKILKLVEE